MPVEDVREASPRAGAALECRPFSPGLQTMLEINPLLQAVSDIEARTAVLRGYL